MIRASELSLSCTVCLFEYYKDEAVTLLPCSHLYHTEVRNRGPEGRGRQGKRRRGFSPGLLCVVEQYSRALCWLIVWD